MVELLTAIFLKLFGLLLERYREGRTIIMSDDCFVDLQYVTYVANTKRSQCLDAMVYGLPLGCVGTGRRDIPSDLLKSLPRPTTGEVQEEDASDRSGTEK